jgi:hypothetical protein
MSTQNTLETKLPAIEMTRKTSRAEVVLDHVVTIGNNVGKKTNVVANKTLASPRELKARTTGCCCLSLITMTAYDAFDTITDIHFTYIMFSEGYNLWGLFMSIASLFGLFNFLCSLPCFKYCFDRKSLLFDNSFLPYQTSKLPGKIKSNNRPLKVTKGANEAFYTGSSGTRADDLMMYLFVFKLPEDVTAAIIRIFYLYQKAEFVSWGDEACGWSCKVEKLGTFTNMIGIVVGVVVCLYFIGVMFNIIRKFTCCAEVVAPFVCYFLGIASLSVMACFFLGYIAISPPSFSLTLAAEYALFVLIGLIVPVSFYCCIEFLRSSLKEREVQDI